MHDSSNEQEIPVSDFVLRNIHFSHWVKKRPKEASFSPLPDGLSINWEKHCSIDNSFVIIGCSKRVNSEEYKKYQDFKIIRFNVGELKQLKLIDLNLIKVFHDPQVNNFSHSLVCYDENDAEIRVKMCDMVEQKYSQIVFKPENLGVIEADIEACRGKLSKE